MFFSLFGRFFKGATILSGAYVLGMFGFSPSWILVIVFLWLVHKKKLRDKDIRVSFNQDAVTDEKGAILARLEDLPPWVFFPDMEQVEWLNTIIQQLWPYIGHFVEGVLREKVEPAIRANLPTNLQSFKFEKVILGDMPFRIGGVRVYHENTAEDEIIMDVEILYSGDCRFSLRIKGLKAGIKDVQLHGMIRIEMKPLVRQVPLVGGLSFYFLKPPAINFDLTNFTNILDTPGLSNILHKIIVEQLSSVMVLPNKITLSLTESVPLHLLKFLPPAGVLQVEVLEAKQLMASDLGFGSTDPYVIVIVGSQEFRTPVITNDINPVWNHQCEAIVNQVEGLTLDVEVMDEDKTSRDDFLGRTSIKISSVTMAGRINAWYPLEEAKSGWIHLEIAWLTLTDNINHLETIMHQRKSDFSSSLLMLFIDSAKNLPDASQATGEPNPQLKLKIAKYVRYTSVRPKTNNPVWEENFSFLLKNPHSHKLRLEVTDVKSGKSLGNCSFQVSHLLQEKNNRSDQTLKLQGSRDEASIFLMLQLKILKYKVPPTDIATESTNRTIKKTTENTIARGNEAQVSDNEQV
ncbi:extended synaptotagmin-2-like isoform X3 [Limulus polyphemus]|nr:extended synaptotagmin-2-like isoform X3 [Limulus polyphemus]